jgi:hypothetical protein
VTNNWIPEGSTTDCKSGRGKRKCVSGNWDDSGCECWADPGGFWVKDGYDTDCPGGLSGRRHCNKGVLEGTCSDVGSCKTEDGTLVSSRFTADCKGGPGHGKRMCTNGNWDISACDCKVEEANSWLPSGSSNSCPDGMTGSHFCNKGVLEGVCSKAVSTEGQCWDGKRGGMVSDGTTLSCTQGGTRMCSKGQWRVVNGDCTGQEITDEQGRKQTIVTSTYKGGRR